MLVVNSSRDNLRKKYGSSAHPTEKGGNDTIFVDMKSGTVKRIMKGVFHIEKDALYLKNSTYSNEIEKYSVESGELISSVTPSGGGSSNIYKFPGRDKAVKYSGTTASGNTTLKVLHMTTLESVREVSTSFLTNTKASASAQGNNFFTRADEEFLYITLSGSERGTNRDLYFIAIVDIDSLVSGSETIPKHIFLGFGDGRNKTKSMNSRLLAFGEKSVFFEFGKYHEPYSGRHDAMRFCASISRKRIRELLSSSTASDPLIVDASMIEEMIQPEKYEEEYIFGLSLSDSNYTSSDGNDSVYAGQISSLLYHSRDTLSEANEYHRYSGGSASDMVFKKAAMAGHITRRIHDMRLSSINDYFPVYHKPVSKYGKLEFANHLVVGNGLNAGNHFVEQTSFFLDPIPVFDREIIKTYLRDYKDFTQEQWAANSGRLASAAAIVNNPSHVTPTHLHMFDLYKYTRYKLIFD